MPDEIVTPEVVDPLIGAEPPVPPPTDEVPPVVETPPPVEPLAEPPAEPPAEPEVPETPPVETTPEPGAPKRKPKARLEDEMRELREERRALRERLDTIERERNEERARVQQAQQALAPQPPQEPQGWTKERLDKLREDDPIEYGVVVAQIAQAQAEQARQQTAMMQTQMAIRDDIDAFQRRQPDYGDAIKFLQGREEARLRAAGVPEAELPAWINFRTGQLMQLALQQGKSVAQMGYEVAKAEGWTVPAAPVTPTVPVAAIPVTAPALPAPTPEQRIAASRAASAQAAGSLSTIDGSGSTSTLPTREELAKWTDKDFEAATKRFGEGWEERVGA